MCNCKNQSIKRIKVVFSHNYGWTTRRRKLSFSFQLKSFIYRFIFYVFQSFIQHGFLNIFRFQSGHRFITKCNHNKCPLHMFFIICHNFEPFVGVTPTSYIIRLMYFVQGRPHERLPSKIFSTIKLYVLLLYLNV